MIPGIEINAMEFGVSEKCDVLHIEAQIPAFLSVEQEVWELLANRYNFAQIMQKTHMSVGELKELMIRMKASTPNPNMSYLQMMNYAMQRYGEKDS